MLLVATSLLTPLAAAEPAVIWSAASGNRGISSDAWFFDPRASAFRGKIGLGGYLWEVSSAGKSLVWVHKGIIRQVVDSTGTLSFIELR